MKKCILYCIFPGLVAFIPVGQTTRLRTWSHPEFSLRHNQFAFNLMNALLKEDTAHNNKLIAPVSLYFSLGMLCNGAAHATRDSIRETLQAGDIDMANINSNCKEALQQMPLADNSVQFGIANSIWYNRRKMTLSPTYESIAGNFFYVQPQPLNFGARDAVVHINQWIDQNTAHMIPTLIDHTKPNDGMYLLNAFYFKADWWHAFAIDHSYEADFYTSPTAAPKKEWYMNRTAIMPVFSDTAFTMVELPCGAGKNYSLFAVLPENETLSADALLRSLTPAQLNDALDKTTTQYINLSIPRWECTYSIPDLHTVLGRLGMNIAFDPKGEADFSNMYSTGARKAALSQARHTTCIRVNETGVEAAPAIATSSETTAMPLRSRHQPRVISFDHPFLYFLIDKQRNLLLLSGIVNDPTLTGATVKVSPKPAAVHRRLWRKK